MALTDDSTIAASQWCQALARTLKMQHIGRDGKPYLDRYFAAGWNPTNRQQGPALFLHHFVASDQDDAVHSHPWGWSASLILSGGYREERCSPHGQRTTRELHPGDVNIIEANDKHRIDLIAKDCWTLFLAGNYQQPWGFAPRC
jgi:quercetin dioxygenase-like cupin family protein